MAKLPLYGPGSQVRNGLPAGGRWIRTFGPPTDPLPFRDSSPVFHDVLTVSRPGTEGSNPSPSTSESNANLTSLARSYTW